MTLNRLAIGATASGPEVGGSGTGNDQQLKDLIQAIGNEGKRQPWSTRRVGPPRWSVPGGETRKLYGYSRYGDWVKNVAFWVENAASLASDTLTISMFKTATRAAVPENPVYIVPEQVIAGADAQDETLIVLPVTMPYIGIGEFWEVRATAVNSWLYLHMTIQLASLHRAP